MQFPLTAGLFLDNEENSIVSYNNPQFKNNNQPFYRNGLKNLTKRDFNNPMSQYNKTFITSNGKLLYVSGGGISDENGNVLHRFDTKGIQSKRYFPDAIDINLPYTIRMKIENGAVIIQNLNDDTVIYKIVGRSSDGMGFEVPIVNAFFVQESLFIVYAQKEDDIIYWVLCDPSSKTTQKITLPINSNKLYNNAYGVMRNDMIYLVSQGNEGMFYFTYNSTDTVFFASNTDGKYISLVQNMYLTVSDTGKIGNILGDNQFSDGISWKTYDPIAATVMEPEECATAPGLISFIVHRTDSVTGSRIYHKHYFNDKKPIGENDYQNLVFNSWIQDNVATESIKRYPFIWNTSIDITPVHNTGVAGGMFRILYNNSVMQAISYVSSYDTITNKRLDQIECSQRVGSLLIPFGSMDSNYPPRARVYDSPINPDDNFEEILFKDQNKVFCLIRISNEVDKRIIKIHDKLYKINTVSIKNIMYEDGDNLSFEFGSLDWNNRLYADGPNLMSTTADDNLTPFALNSGYNVLYESNGGLYHSTSLNSGNINVSFNLTKIIIGEPPKWDFRRLMECFNRKITPSNQPWVVNTNIDGSFMLDVFFNPSTSPIYLSSGNRIRVGEVIVKPELKGTVYPTPDVSNISTPLPIYFTTEDTSNTNSLVTVGYNQQAFLQQYKNYPMDNFYFSSILYRNYISFTILGTYNYVYDGKYIFAMNRQGTITLNLTEVCKAYNYIFLGNSYTEAYFYNRFDKSIYVFAGDRRLTKMVDISNRPEPFTYKFSSSENQMYLMFKDELLIVSPVGQIYNYKIPQDSYDSLVETNDGCWVHGDTNNFLLRLNPLEPNGSIYVVDSLSPLHFETEYIGVDSQTLLDLQEIIVRVHTDDTTTMKHITWGVETISSASKDVDTKDIIIQPEEWDYTGHMNIRIIPKYLRGLGHKLTFTCPEQIQVCSIEWNAIPVAKLPTQGRRSV